MKISGNEFCTVSWEPVRTPTAGGHAPDGDGHDHRQQDQGHQRRAGPTWTRAPKS